MTGLGTRLRRARLDAVRLRRIRWLRGVARSGYVASGLLRILIGVLAFLLAAQIGDREVNATTAFAIIGAAPAGGVLLAIVAGADFALGGWLLLQGALYRDPARAERWRQRSVYWSRAAVYLVIGFSAARVAFGVHESSARLDRAAGARLLTVPGGSIVLGLVGATVLSIGIGMIWVAAVRKFRDTIRLPDDRGWRITVLVLGIVGYAVQGATIALVGGFLLVAAATSDAAATGGLNDTLGAFAGSPFGRTFLGVVAGGWIAAGLYALLRARIARLDDD